jgi:hypothetical protein
MLVFSSNQSFVRPGQGIAGSLCYTLHTASTINTSGILRKLAKLLYGKAACPRAREASIAGTLGPVQTDPPQSEEVNSDWLLCGS